ncbi:unnamed protein product, partial [Didymodactylos carnosus]
HEKALWAIIPMGSTIVTGAADKVIIAWNQGQIIKTFKAVLNKDEFLSCANDNSIRRWNLISGQCIQEYNGHTSFVYSISVISENRFVSSGEDRSIRLWSIDNNESIQTIRLPAQSLWSVTVLSNQDIVVGSSDGRVYVFTTDQSRTASNEEIANFEQEISQSSITTKTGDLGEVKIDDLPGKEALEKPGKRDGQTTMINCGNGNVEAYQWNDTDRRWMKIGDVVGSADSTSDGQTATGEKIMFEGKLYDYVFNVDLGDEHIPLKLPYNATEDPWFAAQNFIYRHELSQMFLDQIANFIVTNTKGMVIDQKAPDFVDPFTGSGRYVPVGKSSTTQSRNTDPFTGTGRYIPDSAGAQQQSQPSNYPVTKRDAAICPQTQYIKLVNAEQTKILGKLKEFNKSEIGDELRLSDAQLQSISDLVNNDYTNLETKLNV